MKNGMELTKWNKWKEGQTKFIHSKNGMNGMTNTNGPWHGMTGTTQFEYQTKCSSSK